MKDIFKLITSIVVTIIVAALVNKKTNGKASDVVNDGIGKTCGFVKKTVAKIFEKKENASTVNLNENNGSETATE